jgi:predicted RNase H-like HicB family nuclease
VSSVVVDFTDGRNGNGGGRGAGSGGSGDEKAYGIMMSAIHFILQRGGRLMLASYIDRAMEHARYEIIEDDGSYWGEIPGLQGVWARHETLEGCRRELREALSDWIALRLRLGLSIPVIDGIDINQIAELA